MIDPTIYARYMTAIADRLRFPLADATLALYYVTLSEALDTDAFEFAAKRVFAEYQDFGFPPPSVFLGMVPKALPDPEAILRQISALGSHNPRSGWQYPRIETVREKLGDAVADAYGLAGQERCFSDNDTSRDIARRAFASELVSESRPLLLRGGERKALPPTSDERKD